MKCSKCGQEFPEGTRFCENCGTELTAEVQPAEEVKQTEDKAADTPAGAAAPIEEAVVAAPVAEERKEEVKKESRPENGEKPNKGGKKLLLPIAAVVVLLLLLVSVFGGKKGGYLTYAKKSIIQMVSDGAAVYVFTTDGAIEKLKVDGCNSEIYSADRSTVAFLDDEDELMIYKNGKLISTGIDDVESICVSAYGDTVAYLGDVKNGNGTLYLYDVKKKKAKEIEDDVRRGTIVLSPNGNTVAFVGDYEDSEDFKGYYSIGGRKSVEVGKEKQVFAIADKAAYIYYKDGDRLYVKKGKKDGEKLATGVGSFTAYFNAGMTQMLYSADGKTYITNKAGEKVKVCGDVVYSMVLPQDSVSGSYSMARGTINFTFVKNFAKQLVYAGGDIYYIKPNFESVKTASNVIQCALAKNGKKLYMIGSKRELIAITDFAKGGKKKELTNEGDLTAFVTDFNLKKVYVKNEDNELMLVKSGKKTKKFADDVTSYALSKDGATCYFVVEGETLYYSKNAGKKVKVKEEKSVDCLGMNGVVLVSIDDGDEHTICSVNGKKLKELHKFER